MKLRNKKTGKIISSKELLTDDFIIDLFSKDLNYFNSKVNKITGEWEDVLEEPEEHYFISNCGEVKPEKGHSLHRDQRIEIGNDFESKEDADKVVEKLKAWKRLKDKGFRFEGWTIDDGLKISICTNFEGDNIYSESEKEIRTNLDLLFGGEE